MSASMTRTFLQLGSLREPDTVVHQLTRLNSRFGEGKTDACYRHPGALRLWMSGNLQLGGSFPGGRVHRTILG